MVRGGEPGHDLAGAAVKSEGFDPPVVVRNHPGGVFFERRPCDPDRGAAGEIQVHVLGFRPASLAPHDDRLSVASPWVYPYKAPSGAPNGAVLAFSADPAVVVQEAFLGDASTGAISRPSEHPVARSSRQTTRSGWMSASFPVSVN